MKGSKDIFLEQQIVYAQMDEDIFKEIPQEYRDKFTDWQREPNDYNELKKDDTFCKLYKEYRNARKKLNDYKYQLRQK
jgi:hypothetical protein